MCYKYLRNGPLPPLPAPCYPIPNEEVFTVAAVSSKVIEFPQREKKESSARRTRRKDGLYHVELRYKDANGIAKKKSFYGKTQSEAIAKKKTFERDLEAGLSVDASKITLKAYADAWLEKQKLKFKNNPSNREFAMYEREIKRLCETIAPETPLRAVKKTDLQSVLDGMEGRGGGAPSASAVKKTRQVIKNLFEDAVDDGYLLRDPARKLELPDSESGTHEEIGPEMRKLITDTWEGDRFGRLAMLMLYAGLRRGEAAALTYEDVDLKKKEINVRSAVAFDSNQPISKGPKSSAGRRTIPIPPQLLPVFSKDGKGLVVLSASGQQLTQSALDRGWESYLYYLSVKLCGVNKRWVSHYNEKAAKEQPDKYNKNNPKYVWQDVFIRMHDLRHTYATMLYDAGVDVKRAQYLLGHSDPETTMKIYIHLSKLREQRSNDAMKSYFENGECFKTVGNNVGK